MCFVLTVHWEIWRRCNSSKSLKAKKLHFWLDQFWGEAPKVRKLRFWLDQFLGLGSTINDL